jgi:RNA polymerase sigma factor (sigma-70 family)
MFVGEKGMTERIPNELELAFARGEPVLEQLVDKHADELECLMDKVLRRAEALQLCVSKSYRVSVSPIRERWIISMRGRHKYYHPEVHLFPKWACSEAELIVNGDFVEGQQALLMWAARRICQTRNEETLQDFFNELNGHVLKNLQKFDPERGYQFSTWLFQIAINLYKQIRRDTKKQNNVQQFGTEEHIGADPRGLTDESEYKAERFCQWLNIELIRDVESAACFYLHNYESFGLYGQLFSEITLALEIRFPRIRTLINSAETSKFSLKEIGFCVFPELDGDSYDAQCNKAKNCYQRRSKKSFEKWLKSF